MWESIRQTADIDWLRRDAERRLLQLRAFDDIDLLQRRLDAFAAHFGQRAQGWDVRRRASFLACPSIPADALRILDVRRGDVALYPRSPPNRRERSSPS